LRTNATASLSHDFFLIILFCDFMIKKNHARFILFKSFKTLCLTKLTYYFDILRNIKIFFAKKRIYFLMSYFVTSIPIFAYPVSTSPGFYI